MEKLYTTAEVAALLQIHEGTARKWLRDGRLNGVDTDAGWRVQESDLQAWLDGQRGKGKRADTANRERQP